MSLNYKPAVLIVLDGFGIAPESQSNAVSLAKKPFFDALVKNYPTTLLQASGEAVGLPWGEVGNSEVGHVNIGSGVLKYQSLPRINKAVSTGQFFKLPALKTAAERVKKKKGKLHLIGLLGNGGVHSSQEHLEALISLAKSEKIKEVYLHLFLDGRDTAKDSAKIFLTDLLKFCHKQKIGNVATMGGRFYGMDRNHNWDRVKKAYDAAVFGQSPKTHSDPIKAVDECYRQNIFDEEIEPIVMTEKNKPVATIEDGDTVIFFNFRADRSRQIVTAFTEPKFNQFATKKFRDLSVITFTEYEKDLPVSVVFPPELIEKPLAKVFSDYNIGQLHLAETEKYAHVTFFLNGMIEEPFDGEERVLVPSPGVTAYDEKPEMSAHKVTEEAIKALKKNTFGFLVINYANADMVGHTGNLKATVKAVETVDECLAKIVPAVLKNGGAIFIVGDHGNAEEMFNPATGDIDKEHNMYPVPFIAIAENLKGQNNPEIETAGLAFITPTGILADVAVTILTMTGLEVPPEMTGTCLF